MEKVKIEGDVKKIRFRAEDTGWGVFSLDPVGGPLDIDCVGVISDLHEGEHVVVHGKMKPSRKWGQQFHVESIEVVAPTSQEGIIRYLKSDRFKGIGKVIAERIYAAWGDKTIEILEGSPERLNEVKGISKKAIANFTEAIGKDKVQRELIITLASVGVGGVLVNRIHHEWGKKSLDMIRENPYQLTQLKGFGFIMADRVAKLFSIFNEDPRRVKAFIEYVIDTMMNSKGETIVQKSEILRQGEQFEIVEPSWIEAMLENMVKDGSIVEIKKSGTIFYAFGWVIEMERYIYEKVNHKLSLEFESREIECFPDEPDEKEMHESQLKAIEMSDRKGILCITGGPGTGKTTVIEQIARRLKGYDLDVELTAPTGRAAKRITELTNFPARTIHRMLGYSPQKKGFAHDEENPLDAEVIVIDESSMMDEILFWNVLKGSHDGCRIILVGDADQLPPVGPGDIFRNLLDRVPTVRLTENFRQSDGLIVRNAARINRGETLIKDDNKKSSDFLIFPVTIEELALRKMEEEIGKLIQAGLQINDLRYQIIIPTYKGDGGIDKVNERLQARNPGTVVYNNRKRIFKEGDKVMQIKNNYNLGVFNGELGLVVGRNGDRIQVDFDSNIIEYSEEELNDLKLAYAASVHKAQGSEFDLVILVMMPCHRILLSRQLFYTAVTRARKMLFLITNEKAVLMARNKGNYKKNTAIDLLWEDWTVGGGENKSEPDSVEGESIPLVPPTKKNLLVAPETESGSLFKEVT